MTKHTLSARLKTIQKQLKKKKKSTDETDMFRFNIMKALRAQKRKEDEKRKKKKK